MHTKTHKCPECGHLFGRASSLETHHAKCVLLTSSQRAAASSLGCYVFRARQIGEADRDAERRVASAVGGTVPVLRLGPSRDEKNKWRARVHEIVQLVAAASSHALYIGSTNAEGLCVDPGVRFVQADDPRLVKCVTRRGSRNDLNYTSQNEDGGWVFAARQHPLGGARYPVPAMVPIAVSFDPTLNTTVVEGKLVRLGHEGKGPAFLNPPRWNAGYMLKMAEFGSVLYLVPSVVGWDEADEVLGKSRAANNEKRKRKQRQNSEDNLSQSSSSEDEDADGDEDEDGPDELSLPPPGVLS